MVLGNVEDEKTFFILTFMKSKLKNRLTTHLDLVVKIYAQDFLTFQSFPFYIAITEWNEEKSHYGLELEVVYAIWDSLICQLCL
jgi:hypothetical protein